MIKVVLVTYPEGDPEGLKNAIWLLEYEAPSPPRIGEVVTVNDGKAYHRVQQVAWVVGPSKIHQIAYVVLDPVEIKS